jgi:hypothetical protein
MVFFVASNVIGMDGRFVSSSSYIILCKVSCKKHRKTRLTL